MKCSSLVTAVKSAYRNGSKGQRAALRAWMRRVLADDDGNDSRAAIKRYQTR